MASFGEINETNPQSSKSGAINFRSKSESPAKAQTERKEPKLKIIHDDVIQVFDPYKSKDCIADVDIDLWTCDWNTFDQGPQLRTRRIAE